MRHQLSKIWLIGLLLISSVAGSTRSFAQPAVIDSDNDGLSDEAEPWHGTDPTVEDTDGDDILDGTEVANGTDPLVQVPKIISMSRTVTATD